MTRLRRQPVTSVRGASRGIRVRAIGFALACAIVVAGCWWLVSSRPRVGPIILISIDTLRADHLPAYGYRALETPAIDRLARDGVVFERAYSHVPLTLPAHTSILSGLLPFEHGVRDNVGFLVRPGQQSLARWLHEGGFETAGVVSADVLRKDTGLAQGFDFYDSQMPPVVGDVSSDRVRRDGLQSLAVAERWLDQRRSSRFFLFLHLYEPHAPYARLPRFSRWAPYDAAIAYADEIVGRLMASLRQRGLYDSATIVLLSDHGEGLGDHGEEEHGLFLYQDTLRVPLIIKLPGSQRGRRIAQAVQHIDIVPTLLDLVGRPIPPQLRGRSLRPMLEGRSRGVPDTSIYSESLYGRYHFGWSELTALTDQRYGFVHAPRDELYDLSTDPHERRNLASARPHIATAMGGALATLARGSAIHTAAAVGEEERQRLASLGYATMEADVAPQSPGESLADPKDKVGVLRDYQRLLALTQQQRVPEAIELVHRILSTETTMTALWFQLGILLEQVGRTNDAVDAYRRVLLQSPDSTSGALALSSALLKLGRFDEAKNAAETILRSRSPREPRDVAAAHEALSRIALARNDATAARQEAAAAGAADPSLPLTDYVEGRLQYMAGRYDDALASFERALYVTSARTRQIANLHLYTGDTLARSGRFAEAEQQFLDELKFFPQNMLASASLANLYHAEGRDPEGLRVLEELLRTSPSPDGYALVAQMLTSFGETAKADEVRAASRRRFGVVRSP